MTHRRGAVAGRLAVLPLAAALLAGCAGFSDDGGFTAVAALSRERTGRTPVWHRADRPAPALAARIAEIAAGPLDADRAVELAFLASPALQARYAAVGVAEADRVRAGRLANPVVGYSHAGGGGRLDIDRSISMSLLGLLTLPATADIGRRQFDRARLQAAQDTVELAGQVRAAYYRAVAARQLDGYARQVLEAADASAELARRMQAAGNVSRLAQLRQQAFESDAQVRAAAARHAAVAAREALVRLLGPDADPLLPDRLPDLPPDDGTLRPADAEQAALSQRLDLQLAQQDLATTAASLGLVRSSRFVDVLELGALNKGRSGQALQQGYAVRFSLPLFESGAARDARAEALYRGALDTLADRAIQVQSEAREAFDARQAAHAVARHYRDAAVPLRARIADENLRRYNGMLIGVFELLADAREQIATVADAIAARRDFWLADNALRLATGSGPAAGSGTTAATPATAPTPAPATTAATATGAAAEPASATAAATATATAAAAAAAASTLPTSLDRTATSDIVPREQP